MHRLPADTAALAMERPPLSKEAEGHLRVLRPKDGEQIELFDGRGLVRAYTYSRSDGPLVAAGAGPRLRARPPDLILFACVTKGSRWDWTVEKATELGATRIVPVISERTVVRIAPGERAAKRDRWLRIALEAARQSDAAWLPEIDEPTDFSSSLAAVAGTDCYVGALTSPPPRPLAECLRGRSAAETRPPALYVGPEGDFTPGELAALLRIATPAGFGPSVLRAETAAIFALSVLAAHLHAKL